MFKNLAFPAFCSGNKPTLGFDYLKHYGEYMQFRIPALRWSLFQTFANFSPPTK